MYSFHAANIEVKLVVKKVGKDQRRRSHQCDSREKKPAVLHPWPNLENLSGEQPAGGKCWLNVLVRSLSEWVDEGSGQKGNLGTLARIIEWYQHLSTYTNNISLSMIHVTTIWYPDKAAIFRETLAIRGTVFPFFFWWLQKVLWCLCPLCSKGAGLVSSKKRWMDCFCWFWGKTCHEWIHLLIWKIWGGYIIFE